MSSVRGLTFFFRFGARVRSLSTGIIWNSEMDDFSYPGVTNLHGYLPADYNIVAPGKRPMSSMSPIVIYNGETGQVRLACGAMGSPRMITGITQVSRK
jgi:gamma-glutamyltranspeptidase / glutathione hydrolase / leukotriene-C4 hydrolase